MYLIYIIYCSYNVYGGDRMDKKNPFISSDISNLVDAGCSNQFIKKYNEVKGNQELRIKMLYEHRGILLKEIHKDQRKLDCLDFLINKEKRKEN